MRIIVTREDIENGRPRDAQNCPVAMALRRAGVGHFGVSGILVWVASGNQAIVLPGPAQEWILNYDYGCQMAPFEFELSLTPVKEPEIPTLRPQDSGRKLHIELLDRRGMSPQLVRIRRGCAIPRGRGRRAVQRRHRDLELVGL